MKIISTAIPFAGLCLVLGCAHQNERQRRYQTTHYPSYSVVTPQEGSRDEQGADIGVNAPKTNAQNTIAFFSSDIFSTDMADNRLVSGVREAVNGEDSLEPVAPMIQIGASQGNVALFGQVGSVEEKKRVEELAWATPGVVSVNNQIEIAGLASADALSRADGETLTDVNMRAGASGSAALAGNIERTGSTNGLTATSRDGAGSSIYFGKETNQVDGIAEQLTSTSRVGNQGQTGGISVEVRGSSQNDRNLAQQIIRELRADTSLASAISRVSISIKEGRVSLGGSVKNEVQKREIESAIQRITGISSIDNQLRVGSPGLDSLPRNP